MVVGGRNPLGPQWWHRPGFDGSSSCLNRLDRDCGNENILPTIRRRIVSQCRQHGVRQSTFSLDETSGRVLVAGSPLQPVHPRREIVDQRGLRMLSHIDAAQWDRQGRLAVAFQVAVSRE